MTYANVVATLALVVAMGGTAAAAGVLVTSNSQVRHDTISGHQPPSGRHANIIAGSVNGRDLSTGVKNSLQVHCANSLQRATSGLCFDPKRRAAADFFTALQQCRSDRLRLPSIGELAEVYENTDAQQSYSWTTDLFDTDTAGVSMGLGQTDSRELTLEPYDLTSQITYRCVGTPTN
jgi:hypothetical protein